MPASEPLPERNKALPYFFLGDSAFALSESMMKPYPGKTLPAGSRERIFNYRLSRARRVIENVFGIMASVFRVLRKPLLVEPDKAAIIVMTICHLHNFLRENSSNYITSNEIDTEVYGQLREGSWRHDSEMTSFRPIVNTGRRSAKQIKEIRDELADYFMNEGSIPWQNQYS